MITDLIHEDRAARALSDATNTRHAMMKTALTRPINVPAGFTQPIELIAEARKAMAADRLRANVVPFVRKAAPAPRPAPPPACPLRPAARAVIEKLSRSLDHKRRPSGLGDLFRSMVGAGGAR